MALSLNPALQTPLQSSLIQVPVPAAAADAAVQRPPTEGNPSVEDVGDVSPVGEDTNQAQQRDEAAFSPTDGAVDFGKDPSPTVNSENPSELPPLKVDPPLTDVDTLINGKNVLRGDALQTRLKELGTQTTNGITALSERKDALSATLADLAPESPEHQELTETIGKIEKATEQLTTLQGLLHSEDPKSVEALQRLLVKEDNSVGEEPSFEKRLTYPKPDGSEANFDNLYGKRTDAGVRDYIARLVEEVRVKAPASGASDNVSAADVEGGREPEATERSTTPEASLSAAADVPAVQEEIAARPEAVSEVPEVSDVPETPALPEGATPPDALNAVTTFLDTEPHGDVVSHFTALASEFSALKNSGENARANDVAEKLTLFMDENKETLAAFRMLYEKLGTTQKEQVDGRILEGVQQFIEANPELVKASSVTANGAESVKFSSLYDMNWNSMGSTLYSGNTTMMA